MLEKLQAIINKYENLREESLKPEIFEDMEKAKKINKELSSLEKTYELAQNYKKALETLNDAQEMLDSETDPELVAMAQEELEENKAKIEEYVNNNKMIIARRTPTLYT